MKYKHLLLPYILIILIIPALIAHLSGPLNMNTAKWEWAVDILMAFTGLVGLLSVIISRKKNFRGWIPLLLLLFLVILPQVYLWKTQGKGISDLRQIWRFALFYLTLFIIPQEVHYTHRELTWLIGGILLWGLFCCGYEVWQHPKVWDGMSYFGGKREVNSFFGQHNRFGAYCALWMILSLFAIRLSGSRFWLIPAVIFAAFLVMTESRGASLLAVLFLFSALISYRRRLGTKNLLMILLDILIVAAILWMIPPVRDFIRAYVDVDRGVTGRDRIWQAAWEYYLESNPLLGHGLGVQIERIMAERIRMVVNTHNTYLYILNSGGILLVIFYIISIVMLLQHRHHRRHYVVPLLIGILGYGFVELACAPFDNWHLSTMFTVCLFFFPAAAGITHRRNYLPIFSGNAETK